MSEKTEFAFCEPKTASILSREHIRRVGPEGRKPGGGIPNLALCGADVVGGWDLASEVTADRLALLADINPTCRRCAELWAEVSL